jgi:PhnB protein
MSVKPIPDGYHTVTPYLTVPGVARLIDFLKQAFDATEIERLARPDGTVMHAEVRIGDSVIMMGEPIGQFTALPVSLYIYVKDADAAYQRALHAGATPLTDPVEQFYGDRSGSIQDPSGNRWFIATHIEDVPPDEISRRAEARMSQQGGA